MRENAGSIKALDERRRMRRDDGCVGGRSRSLQALCWDSSGESCSRPQFTRSHVAILSLGLHHLSSKEPDVGGSESKLKTVLEHVLEQLGHCD